MSVGTDHHPYHRMLEWGAIAIRRLDVDLFVQRGATPGRSDVEAVDYLDGLDLADQMRKADAVVCHGGPGTISLATRCGHRPIVMPRDPERGEHIDDHQMRYAAKLAREGTIDVAHTVDELLDLLAEPRARLDPVEDAMPSAAIRHFSDLTDRLLNGTLPRRRWRNRVLWSRS